MKLKKGTFFEGIFPACWLPACVGPQPAQRLEGVAEEAGKVPARPGTIQSDDESSRSRERHKPAARTDGRAATVSGG